MNSTQDGWPARLLVPGGTPLRELPSRPAYSTAELLRTRHDDCETSLKLRGASRDVEIAIGIFLPEQSADGAWFCRYEVDWPDGTWKSRAGGVDSIQALTLALQMIGSDIYTSDHHKSGKLFLDAPGQGYGFPVPNTLRDLLEGDDKKFM